ncbi:amidohydrolase [Shimia sp. R11_0]|uniref:amidohydrolase family protein n=1 Tax=Shimia sp. R11_0 TaxID=2821096 RepID=UPI001ADC4FA2|nr:amidohydrolase family protein [Shimia sp. R11_0]MBO9477977.1 amidohydrolase [Shimia sp. R11_0]
MTSYKFTNCHIHLFTLDHLPPDFPIPYAQELARRPWLLKQIAKVMKGISPLHAYGDMLERLARTIEVGNLRSQEDVLRTILPHYSEGTRFVVLPMDIAPGGYSRPKISLQEQHTELYHLTQKPIFKDLLLPFGKVHPSWPGAFDEFRRCIEELGFHGLKIYPKLGYAPDHPVLMEQVYPYCIEHNLPVMTHCSRGGAFGKGLHGPEGQELGAPHRYIPVLEAFPELRVCLAHFGGDAEWKAYTEGINPLDPREREKNWVTSIYDMITSGTYENLYTDISYAVFNFADNVPALGVLLENDKLRERVLFGSDYYMTKQEDLSERQVSMRLRHTLGAEVFEQISTSNTQRWLTG